MVSFSKEVLLEERKRQFMGYEIIRITSKGQMTLPKAIREKLKLNKGAHLAVYLNGEEIVLKKVEPFEPLGQDDPIWDLAGVINDHPDVGVNHDTYLVRETSVKDNPGEGTQR